MALVPRIQTTMVADNAVTTAKINDLAVTTTKIVDSAINGNKLANGSVSTGKLDSTMSQYIIPTTSSEIAFPGDNQSTSFAHGLGAVPSRYRVILRCVSAQFGYGVGTEIDITSNLDGDGGRGTTTIADSVSIQVRSNSWSQYYVSRFDGSPGTTPLTPANWRIVFRVWK